MSKRWSDLLELRKHKNGGKNGGGRRSEGRRFAPVFSAAVCFNLWHSSVSFLP